MLSRLALAFLLICGSAYAQTPKPKSTLQSEINNNLPDNTVGQITPSVMRSTLSDLMASWQQYAGVNPQAGVTYTIQTSDYGQLVTFNNVGAVAVTLPQATGSFLSFNTFLKNIGAGTVTVTPGAGSTLCGGATLTLATNAAAWVISDGTNYQCTFFTSDSSPITFPLPVNKGGTGGSVASGTLLDNITGFASTGFLTRTAPGTYAFQSAANGITLNNIQQIPTKTFLCNSTVSTNNITACTGGTLASIACLPQRTVFLTGTNATYNVPTCNSVLPLYLEVEMVGAGGGGGGSGSAAGTAAGSGTASCWNTSGTACSTPLFQAGGGGGGSGATTSTASSGGTATSCDLGLAGANGQGSSPATLNNAPGANGAVSAFGGAGVGGLVNGTLAGGAAVANTGSGGGGGGGVAATPLATGSAGAAGAYCRKFVTSPVASYVYTVGTKGGAGGAGTSGAAGGAGADGIVIVTAKWQ